MKRLLLDENLPRQLKKYFSDQIEVSAVPDLGWQSKRNGELLTAMSGAGIEFLLTADRNLRYQQNTASFGIKIVVLLTYDTRQKTLEPFVALIENRIIDWADPSDNILEIDLRQL